MLRAVFFMQFQLQKGRFVDGWAKLFELSIRESHWLISKLLYFVTKLKVFKLLLCTGPDKTGLVALLGLSGC